jgi:hypothetical protein
VRRDLFNKLGNLTNKASLENQAINLEWSKEEIYAFFFKVIFAQSNEPFFKYIEKTSKISETILKKIKRKINSEKSYNQLPTDKELLLPLIEIFFGKYADFYGTARYGVTYDWLYANLKNADDTISLRPFLDLIYYAILELEQSKSSPDYPIIYPRLFSGQVRVKAVERHVMDLVNEEGNEWLKAVIGDFRNEKIPKEFRYSPLIHDEFQRLISRIIQRNTEKLGEISVAELENVLILNGLISVEHKYHSPKTYTFAYLYAYFLGIRSRHKRKRKRRIPEKQ